MFAAGALLEKLALLRRLQLHFCCDNLWKSKFMATEVPKNLGIFFSYFVDIF